MDAKNTFWTEAYRQNIGRIIAVCYRYVPNRQIAEDLAHDAFLKAMENSSSYSGLGSFSAWLHRIAVNEALQYLRRRPLEVDLTDHLVDCLSEDAEITESENVFYAADFSCEDLLEAIASLSEPYRIVFNLYVMERYGHQKIAETLKITVGTSKSRLARARKQLKNFLWQKNQKQERRSKPPLLFLFFPCCGRHYEDSVCRKQLGAFSLPPLTFQTLPQVTKPLMLWKKGVYSAVGTFAVVSILTGALLLLPNREVQIPETPVGTLPADSAPQAQSVVCDTVIPADSVVLPVVVRKKVIRHRTIVVRDTLTVLP